MTAPTVFIVSENVPVRRALEALVESAGLLAASFPRLQALLDVPEPGSGGCLVFCPGDNTLEERAEQARLTAACAGRPGILIIDRGNVHAAVLALKSGITDVVQKPYRESELMEHILKALEVNAHG
jgi:two-component system response regulator DctR